MPELAPLAQPGFPRAHDRFGAIGNLELAENVRNVIAHRLRTQTQAIGDGGVIYALSNQTKHFTLALTQLWKRMWRCARTRHSEELHHATRDSGTEDGLTVSNRPDCAQNLLFVRVLQHIASGTGAHRREYRIIVVEHRDHQYGGAWA